MPGFPTCSGNARIMANTACWIWVVAMPAFWHLLCCNLLPGVTKVSIFPRLHWMKRKVILPG